MLLSIKKIIGFIRWLIVASNKYNDIRCPIHNSVEFGHYGIGIVIGRFVEIGKNVRVGQNVVIGRRGSNRPVEIQPVIEDDVCIYANAVILGDITIGRGAVVGAGAVVLEDVPPFSLVVGNPAQIIEGKYKEEG